MINTTIEINAPLSKVRSVLLDFPTLRTCRSGLFKAVTPLSPTYPSPTALNPGNQLHVEIGPPFVGAITQNTPSCFEWKGLPNHGVLSGRHNFSFEESVVTKGGTTFVQNEEFGGVLWNLWTGQGSCLALSRKQPAGIYFTGRNSKGAAEVISLAKAANPTVKVIFLECDQTSLTSVESAIKQFLSKSQRLDVLLCNAGVMGTDASVTKDGYEHQFGVNQMAHALMVKMLLPTLQNTASQTGDARIVFESSIGFRWTPSGGIRFDELKTTQDYSFAGRWVRYGQSKLANVVYASELSRRYPNITTVSVHPGVIFTNLWSVQWSLLNRIFVYLATLGQAVSVEEGARNPCWAMTTPKERLSPGVFYEKAGVIGSPSKDSQSEELGEKLWTWTGKELDGYGK